MTGVRWAPRQRDLIVAGPALLLGLVLLLHARIPNRMGNAGSLVETFLPWSGLCIPMLLAGALWRPSAPAAAAPMVPALVWWSLFGGLLTDKARPDGDLTVAEHNVGADNPDPSGTARALVASGADVLALVELTEQARRTYEKALGSAYRHHVVLGTVGLWSTMPLSETRPVDIAMDYGPLAKTIPAGSQLASARALRATVTTAKGPLAVYVAHFASARVNLRAGFDTHQRNRGAEALGKAVAAERLARVVLLGDLNGTMDDRAFGSLTSRLQSAQHSAGAGFGFTWPAPFPVVRIDHILVRGVEPRSSWVLPATSSDHLPVAARISW